MMVMVIWFCDLRIILDRWQGLAAGGLSFAGPQGVRRPHAFAKDIVRLPAGWNDLRYIAGAA
jgi:hypothetical protein